MKIDLFTIGLETFIFFINLATVEEKKLLEPNNKKSN